MAPGDLRHYVAKRCVYDMAPMCSIVIVCKPSFGQKYMAKGLMTIPYMADSLPLNE